MITEVRIFWEGNKILRNLHLTFVCMYYGRWRFRKILWPSQNIRTLPWNLRWEKWVTTDTGTSWIESWGSWDPWRWRPRYHDDVFARHKAEQSAKKIKTKTFFFASFLLLFWFLTQWFDKFFLNFQKLAIRRNSVSGWVNNIYLSIPSETEATNWQVFVNFKKRPI